MLVFNIALKYNIKCDTEEEMSWSNIWNTIKAFFVGNIWNIVKFFAILVIGI